MAGIITAREYFNKDKEIVSLAQNLGPDRLWVDDERESHPPVHALEPEDGFANRFWDHHCELGIMYLQAWIDFRNRRERQEPHTNWFENSVQATLAHRKFCIDLKGEFPATRKTSGASPLPTAPKAMCGRRLNGWTNRDVIGIDVGITLLSAENLCSGKVWTWFNRNPQIRHAMCQIFT